MFDDCIICHVDIVLSLYNLAVTFVTVRVFPAVDPYDNVYS